MEEHFISCWTHDDSESLAMWMIYCRGQNGFAIRSNIGKLPVIRRGVIGKVVYINHDTYIDDPNADVLGNLFRKDKMFSYETEIRLILRDSDEPEKFKKIHVDLNKLVNDVMVSPRMLPWILDMVKSLSSERGFDWEFVRSSF